MQMNKMKKMWENQWKNAEKSTKPERRNAEIFDFLHSRLAMSRLFCIFSLQTLRFLQNLRFWLILTLGCSTGVAAGGS